MKKPFLRRAACVLMTALLLFACQKTEIAPVPSPEPGGDVKTYTLSLVAGKGEMNVKALSLEGKMLNAYWEAGEEVAVHNVTRFSPMGGKLVAQTTGQSTTLSGTLTGDVGPGDILELNFLSDDYDHQEGTLEYIAENCDFASAVVTVVSVDEGVITIKESPARFINGQAIAKFTLKEKDGSALSKVTELAIKSDDWTISVTPASETNVLYVAVPAIKDATFSLTATRNDPDNLRFLEKTSVTLERGRYYDIGAKMSPILDVGDEATLRQCLSVPTYANYILRLTASIALTEGEIPVLYPSSLHLNGKTISGNNSGRIFNVPAESRLTLAGGGTLTNGSADNGGAIYNAGTLIINNVGIRGNTASNQGGAIFNNGGSITLNGGSLSGNAAANAGGIHLNGGSLAVTGGDISENSSTGSCGGVNLTGGSSLTMSGGSIRDNTSDLNDGGVYIGSGSTMTLTGGSITGNRAAASVRGAGISVVGSLTMSGNPQVSDNVANSQTRDVYLPSGKVITVNDFFTEGAHVGIFCQGGKGTTFTSGFKANNPGVLPETIFFADPSNLQVITNIFEASLADQVQIKPSTTSYAMLRETVKLAFTHVYSARNVLINWGDGSSPLVTTLYEDGVLSHEFTQAGDYTIQVDAGDVKGTYPITVTSLLALDKAIAELMSSNKVWVMAHRAHTPDKTIPENSVSAVLAAIAAGADFVETDTQITSDKKVVICHDDTIDATTTGSGTIQNMTYDQIQSYYLTDRNGNATTEKMPTLKDFLTAARGKVYVNLDYSPRHATTAQVMDVVEDLGMTGQVFYYCNSETKVNEVFAINPDAHVYFFHSMTDIYEEMGQKGKYFTQANWYNNLKETDASVINAKTANEDGLLVSTTMLHVLASYIPEYSIDSEMVTSIFNWFPTCKLIMTDCPAELISDLASRGKR